MSTVCELGLMATGKNLQTLQCRATPTACDPQPATLILQLSTQAHSSAFCSAFGLPWEALNTSEIIVVKLSGFLGQGQSDKEDHGADPLHSITSPRICSSSHSPPPPWLLGGRPALEENSPVPLQMRRGKWYSRGPML